MRDPDGYTPLLLSAAVGKAESVRCLLELGSDIRQRDASGLNALQISALKETFSNNLLTNIREDYTKNTINNNECDYDFFGSNIHII